MICEMGKCLVCGAEISRKCESCGNAWKNLESYTTVELKWSNDSKMVTAVCVACSKGPVWTANKTEMTEAIQKAWDKSGGTYDKAVVLV